MHTKQFAIDYLNGLADGKMPADVDMGLCGNLEDHTCVSIELAHALMDTMDRWPEGTGSQYYPVPCPSCSGRSRDAAKHLYLDTWHFWKDTPYGNSRRRLCKWLADELANGNIKVEEEDKHE